jgi:acyl-CoA thioesterase I
MMGSDMYDGDLLRALATRRRWLAHCTALAFAARLLAPRPAGAQGKKAAATILVVGDSLSAEFGLKRGSGWVALLERRLAERNIAARVVNASISGDTTSGGVARLPALLREHRPTHVIVELGGNDALRGLPLAMTRANLAEMAHSARAAGARVLIAGTQVPPNYGRRYTDDFAATFVAVAKSEGAALVPFLLRGVADASNEEALFQSDRIHPNEQAQARLLDNVWPVLAPLLR